MKEKAMFLAGEWYYPAILLVYVLSLISLDLIHPGVFSAVFMLIFWASLAVFAVNKRDMIKDIFKKAPAVDVIMCLWLLYNILSGIWTVLGSKMPVSVYLGELFTTALPMGFYFLGRFSEKRDTFHRNFVLAVAAIGILGIVLYITAPQFYINYLFRLEYVSLPDAPTMRVRMHSVIGSTLMGFLSAAAMLSAAHFFIESEGKKGKIIFFFCAFLAFFSNQRAAMVAAIVIVLYMNYLVFFTFDMLPKKYFAVECSILAAGFFGLLILFRGAFAKVYARLVSLPGAIGQRSDQWVGAANNMFSKWLGNGLGANGHRAIGYTKHLIADGGLAKLYVEMGIIGTSLFVFLMLLVLKKGFKNLKASAPEVGVIIVTLLISIGSNMMSFALAVPVFYYAIGAIAKEAERGEIDS
ncbi:hypothetical protein SAMN06296386_10753 [Lachnospiraceae bacterium]|nr:hypothetical protein SAMN06296386_10753 [Lachnospiraceae bacterium]